MRRTLAASFCAIAALGASLRGSPARADGPTVSFTFEGCTEASVIERVARLELRADGKSVGTKIDVHCAGDEAEIAVDDPNTGKKVDRTVSLAGIDESARPRLLALAVAELVRSSWIELDTNPTPTLPVVAPVPIDTREREAARREAARAVAPTAYAPPPPRWGGSGAFIGMLSYSLDPLFGVELAAKWHLRDHFFLTGGGAALFGNARRTSGTVSMAELVLDLGGGWETDRVDVRLAARLGWGSLSGSPGEGESHGTATGFVAGPMLSVSLRLVGPIRVWAEGGWLLWGVRGRVDGDDDVVLSRAFVALGVGVAF